MSGEEGDRELDERVSESDQISLTRTPELAHDLVTGPYPYARTEQEAWISAARDALRNHRCNATPLQLFAKFTQLATACDGTVNVDVNDGEIVLRDEDGEASLRIAIEGDAVVCENGD